MHNKQFIFSGEKYIPFTHFWEKQIADCPEPFLLRGDVRSKNEHGRKFENFELDSTIQDMLQKYAGQRPFENFIIWTSAISIVLARYTEREKMLVVTPLMKRAEQAYLWETKVPLNLEVTDLASLKTHITTVGKGMKDAYFYQNFPLDLIASDAEIGFDISKMSNIGLAYNLLHINLSEEEKASYPFWIDLKGTDGAQGMSFQISYDGQVFSSFFVQQFARHILRVMHQFQQLDQTIDDCTLLSPTEERQLLEAFNNSAQAYPETQTVLDLFEQQAEKEGTSIAITYQGQSRTYEEVNKASNQLAHYLRKEGVQPGDLIALCLGRSLEMVTAIIGVWKAGAAYVPIDPDFPVERIHYLLEDTQVRMVLSNRGRNPILPDQSPQSIILLDAAWSEIAKEPSGAIHPKPSSEQLAYIIYTSGSTGKPKGVMISHQNLCMRLLGIGNLLELHHQVKTCALTNYVFDVSLLELILPLIFGGSVLIPDKEDIFQIEELIALMGKEGVTKIQATPSFLSNFIAAITLQNARNLKLDRICSGGEPLKKELVAEILGKMPQVKLNNHYGPTETTIDSLALNDIQDYETNIIGQPLPNTSLFIVDKRNVLVPIGVAGELLIGGPGVGMGYLNRKELTAEKFIDNPFKIDSHTKVYRTGDLARWLPNGQVEFLGRIDEQVKIRGFRIELGEIESVLNSYSEIKACTVVAREDKKGELSLVAYVVSNGNFDKQSLQAYLHKRLPDYMVPSTWVSLDLIPLNSNGKVDKKALPDPDISSTAHTDYVAPSNDFEKALVGIWEELLRLEQISVQDDFFELGGHSLLVMKLIPKIYHQFGVKASLPEIFENSVLADLADLIASKAPELYEPIPLANSSLPGELYALSDAQKQMWILEQQQENSYGFILTDFFSLKGILDVARFQDAYEQILRRHESLRTVIKTHNNEPYQWIKPFTSEENWMLYEDLREMQYRRQWVLDKSRQEAQRSFDLEQGPLIRMQLFRLEEEEYVMLMSAHHIITDLESTLIIFKELIQGYNALVNQDSYSLPALRIQYKDYAAWQLAKRDNPAHKAYWLKEFEDFSPAILLAPDFPRPRIKSYLGNTVSFLVGKKEADQVLDFCHRKGISLYMLFFSILNFLLHKYSGQNDISIGSAVSERDHIDLEGQVGLFVNILAFRTQINPEVSFGQFLEEVKQKVLQGYKHQSYSFDDLVRALQLPRVSNRNPLFDIYLAVGVESMEHLGLDTFNNLHIEPFTDDFTKTIHDLSINFVQKPEGIEGTLTYAATLFHPERMESLSHQIKHMVELIIKEEDSLLECPINQIAYLSEEEQQKLQKFHSRVSPYPQGITVIDLFEDQVARNPNKQALFFEGESLTYQELNTRSNQLAHYLKAKGIEKESLVVVCLERSLEMIISILGILKSGGAYLPIDPEYPEERIRFMLEDSACKVMIDQAFYEQFLTHADQYPGTNLMLGGLSDGLYSVIYTSGSTGKPKGVLLEHEGLVNHIFNVKKDYLVDEHSRFLQFFNIGFDAAAQEIFTSLSFGASLYIRSEQDLEVERMIAFINKHAITHADFSTAYFESLIAGMSFHSLKQKLISCGIGGEKVNHSFVVKNQVLIASMTRQFFNVYGPTETTLTVTIFDILKDKNLKERINVPIGKPYPNRRIYLLDAVGNLVPTGVFGEIHIGGVGISRGYLNRAELTAEKFISDPFGNEKNGKLYKTGDLARWLSDGNIEFLGRADSQVKIRGFRIELSEIENKLRAHKEVEDGVVVCRERAGVGKELLAYYIPSTKKEGSLKQLLEKQASAKLNKEDRELLANQLGPLRKSIKGYLSAELPEYMVPSILIEMASFPLTRNGKLDKQSLPDPIVSELILNEFVAPRNEMESFLAGIWKEFLGAEQVGIYDNFFELGGDSIKALQIASRAHKNGFSLEVKDIYEHQQIEAIASHLGKISRIPDQTPVVGIVELNAIQKAFFDWDLRNPHHFNQAVLLTCPVNLEVSRIEDFFVKLQNQHDQLRVRFDLKGETPQQICEPIKSEVTLEYHDLSREVNPAEKLEQIAIRTHQSIDLQQKLWQAVYFKLASSNRLLIVIHHLIIDNLSWRILLDDLLTMYYQAEKGIPLALSLKTDSFKTWTTALVPYAQSSAFLEEKGYWAELSATNIQAIPRDKSYPENCFRDEKTISFSLNEKHTRLLIGEVNKTFRTEINDLLLVALGQAIFKTFGLSKQTIALEGHGRQDILDQMDIKNTVGWFTSLFPHILEYEEEIGWEMNILKVRDGLRRVPQKGTGYGILKYLTPETFKSDLDFSLKPGISFNYLGQFDSDLNQNTFQTAPEATGPAISELNQREYDLEISGMVSEKVLTMAITFNSMHFYEQTIDSLANNYRNALEDCIKFCLPDYQEVAPVETYTTRNISQDNLQKLKQLFE